MRGDAVKIAVRAHALLEQGRERGKGEAALEHYLETSGLGSFHCLHQSFNQLLTGRGLGGDRVLAFGDLIWASFAAFQDKYSI